MSARLRNLFSVEGQVVRILRPRTHGTRTFQDVHLSIMDADSDRVEIFPFSFRVDRYPIEDVSVGDVIEVSFKLATIPGAKCASRHYAIVAAGCHRIVRRHVDEQAERARREMEEVEEFAEKLWNTKRSMQGQKWR